MVETLFFDLDNTLLDFNRAERAAIAKTLKSFHIAPEPSVLKRYSELNLAQWKLLEQGKINGFLGNLITFYTFTATILTGKFTHRSTFTHTICRNYQQAIFP